MKKEFYINKVKVNEKYFYIKFVECVYEIKANITYALIDLINSSKCYIKYEKNEYLFEIKENC